MAIIGLNGRCLASSCDFRPAKFQVHTSALRYPPCPITFICFTNSQSAKRKLSSASSSLSRSSQSLHQLYSHSCPRCAATNSPRIQLPPTCRVLTLLWPVLPITNIDFISSMRNKQHFELRQLQLHYNQHQVIIFSEDITLTRHPLPTFHPLPRGIWTRVIE